MEAEIDHGRVIPLEPDKLPVTGRALLTVLSPTGQKPDFDKIRPWLGVLKTKVDSVEWQRQVRSEWNNG